MKIHEYLLNCREISRLCSQNGWPDNDTLEVEILEQNESEAIATVRFEEILMQGSGCEAGRVHCFGKLRLPLSTTGDVKGMEILIGSGERLTYD